MTDTPEKIYGWLDTQLSIARFYGGCTFNGHNYKIDYSDPEQPLVRQDVVKAEGKAKKAQAKTEKQLEKERAVEQTQRLMNLEF